MKLNRLEETKRLFPHFYDRNGESNFSKHLSIINHQQYDLYHKLKTLDWGRMLEKPIQIWKEQTEPYKYEMHFKVSVKYLKEVNIYKNPKLDKNGIILSYEEKVNPTTYYANDDVNYYHYIHNDTCETLIPQDNYIIEIYTWDDYHFLKGFPEEDYLFYNELDYHFNESYLKIEYEEISYSKYLTFRVHMDRIKMIEIFKNGNVIYVEDFILEDFDNKKIHSTDFSYKYFDYDSFDNVDTIYEIEDAGRNSYTVYRANSEKDEYVFRLPLTDDDLDENGLVKDEYDLFVTVFDKRNRCSKTDIIDYTRLYEKYPNISNFIVVNFLPTPSQNTLNNIYIIKEDGVYNAYETVYDEDTDVYSLNLGLKNVDFETITKASPDRVYKKRYSGYDTIIGDCFEHDYSLDKIGYLYSVPRYRFYTVPEETEYYYSRTYPPYNDRLTEDDYHYMKRIQRYIQQYNQTYFPVLEFWKYYYTDSELVNRKVHLGVQDRTYLRTNLYNCDDVAEVMVDEVFDDDETITEYENTEIDAETSTTVINNLVHYNINKATIISGESSHIVIPNKDGDDYEWDEAIILNNTFVVPTSNYRLRYGVKDNTEPVTIRMVCYNHNGQKVKTLQFSDEIDDGLDDTYYPRTEGYDYVDTLINIPGNTASIIIILESNTPFKFTDVTLQRENVVGFDNKYMKTTENWNSSVYDLYANYSDIPVNLRLDETTRFNLLFRRSLPISKKGFFNLNIENENDNSFNLTTSYSFKIINFFGALGELIIDEYNPFDRRIEGYLEENKTYSVSFHCKSEHSTKTLDKTEDYLVSSQFLFYDENFNLITDYEFTEQVDSQVDAKLNYTITTPPDCVNGRLLITCGQTAKIWDIHLEETETSVNINDIYEITEYLNSLNLEELTVNEMKDKVLENYSEEDIIKILDKLPSPQKSMELYDADDDLSYDSLKKWAVQSVGSASGLVEPINTISGFIFDYIALPSNEGNSSLDYLNMNMPQLLTEVVLDYSSFLEHINLENKNVVAFPILFNKNISTREDGEIGVNGELSNWTSKEFTIKWYIIRDNDPYSCEEIIEISNNVLSD